jgi:amidase
MRALAFLPALLVAMCLPRPSLAQVDLPGAALNLDTATIQHINAAFGAGTLNSVELVDLFLSRIEAYDEKGPWLNSIIALDPGARGLAAELDAERRTSGPRSPLHGIPILVKDNYDTFNLPTTAGSVTLTGSIPPDDAFTISRLREAGAIILGKTNLSEFATPAGQGSYSSLNGLTLNPYDLDRDPAGSSGGTATAIAALFAVVGLGTDTGGSIRGPAAATGLVGIRPTFGLISRDGIIPQAPSLDTAGPMARNVTDAAITLGILAGVDPADAATASDDRRAYEDYTPFLRADALRGARIGVAREFFGGNPAIDALMEDAIGELTALGAIVIDPIAFGAPFLSSLSGLRGRINAELQPHMDVYLATLREGFPRSLREILALSESPEIVGSASPVNPGLIATHRRNLEIGGLDDPEYRNVVENDLPRVRNVILEIMEDHHLDAFVYPTSRCPARTLYTIEDPGFVCESGTSGTNLASFGRLPDIQVPAGFTADGLPTTISFVGRPFSEAELLGFAFAFEQATKHWRRSPLLPPLSGEGIRQ